MVRVFSFFFFCIILLFCVCLFSTVCKSHLLGNETDRLALLSIKEQITSDPFNITSSWNDSNHFCKWLGIECSRKPQRVSVLNLHSRGLVGHISPFIGNLSFLKKLDLHNNSLGGDIPQEIRRLSGLEYLSVANNSFQGQIPSNISLCSNLLILDVSKNHLIGELPRDLGSLRKIIFFSAKDNMLEGSIPPTFGNLTSLEMLDLARNSLVGNIPHNLGQLKQLTFLNLASNNLSSMFPPSLYNLSKLETFGCGVNHLTGTLPVNIGSMLPNLITFLIGENYFYGTFPSSLFNVSKLQKIDIGSNRFTGEVSVNVGNLRDLRILSLQKNDFGSERAGDLDFITPLTNCSKLEILNIGTNHFGGTIPTSVANFSKQLYHLDFSENRISGDFPNRIDNLKNLSFLSLSDNSFSGPIPTSFGNMPKLQSLYLHSNQLLGSVPSFTRNMSNLRDLDLSTNFLGGSISPILENHKLEKLYLHNNNFSGTISKEIGESFGLLIFELSNNNINGSIPPEIGNLVHLVNLTLDNNNLSGEIPKRLVDCWSLQYLYLDGNSLQGSLPPSIDLLKDLHVFHVSHNNISGNIPKELERLSVLTVLDLSFNNLEGEVPMEGIFKNASAISVTGNRNICGGVSKLHLPKCSPEQPRKGGSSQPLKVILGILIPFIMVVFLLVIYLRKKSHTNSLLEEPPFDLCWRVSYGELHEATCGFSPKNLIGAGHYGSVYVGVSHEGIRIAVKVLNLRELGASKNFVSECEALRVARHRNLLKIYTVCSSVDFLGNDFKALVFKFMSNGNLYSLLHPNSNAQYVQRSLNIAQRLDIAIDVASGLDYLHNHGEIPIVHCDLKSSNVLLDDELNACVADFGLARFLPAPNMETTLNATESSSFSIRGTIGYIPPEYGDGGKVSTQGDVYSFGILLLEMFTGKRPTDDIFKDGHNLHDFCRKISPQRVMEIIDMSMVSNIHGKPPNSTNQLEECFSLILKIGVACSVDEMRERMTINDALKKLYSIKRKFLSDMET